MSSLETDECIRVQDDELCVVQAIYGSDVLLTALKQGDGHSRAIRLETAVRLGQQTAVALLNEESGLQAIISVSHLPPIIIELVLPLHYPLSEPATLHRISSIREWIAPSSIPALALQIECLAVECSAIGEGVLCRIIDFIQDGGAVQSLNIPYIEGNGVADLTIPHSNPQTIATQLADWDSSVHRQKFAQQIFACPICLTKKQGDECIQLRSCSHVACKACMTEFWSTSILQGNITNVGCVDEQCVKKLALEKSLTPAVSGDEIQQIVGEALFYRWKMLYLRRDPSTVVCPITTCESLVPRPNEVLEENNKHGWEQLRICPICGFAFCATCKKTWHGPITLCSVEEEYIREYITLSDSSEDIQRKQEIELKYGQTNVLRLAKRFAENQANEEWLSKSATRCPGCNIPVQKSTGCNHITCARCKFHFCYLCGDKLQANNPYKHFSAKGALCYNRLFDGAIDD